MLHALNNGAEWGHGEDGSLSGRMRAVLLRKETFARGQEYDKQEVPVFSRLKKSQDGHGLCSVWKSGHWGWGHGQDLPIDKVDPSLRCLFLKSGKVAVSYKCWEQWSQQPWAGTPTTFCPRRWQFPRAPDVVWYPSAVPSPFIALQMREVIQREFPVLWLKVIRLAMHLASWVIVVWVPTLLLVFPLTFPRLISFFCSLWTMGGRATEATGPNPWHPSFTLRHTESRTLDQCRGTEE